jgi:hypothetical protein
METKVRCLNEVSANTVLSKYSDSRAKYDLSVKYTCVSSV